MAHYRTVAAMLGATMMAALPVPAHEAASGIVKERMDGMETISKAMKEIRRRVDGNRDLAGIASEAARIGAVARRLPQWFPPGSDTPSEALPAVWQRRLVFEAAAMRLVEESGKLAEAAATGDPKIIALQYRAVGEICVGCHRDFRAKKG